MPVQYIPVFIFALLAAAFPAVTLVIFKLIRPDMRPIVETIFLFPWAVMYGVLGLYGLVTMFVFLGILIIGYVWLYKKGALDWV